MPQPCLRLPEESFGADVMQIDTWHSTDHLKEDTRLRSTSPKVYIINLKCNFIAIGKVTEKPNGPSFFRSTIFALFFVCPVSYNTYLES